MLGIYGGIIYLPLLKPLRHLCWQSRSYPVSVCSNCLGTGRQEHAPFGSPASTAQARHGRGLLGCCGRNEEDLEAKQKKRMQVHKQH